MEEILKSIPQRKPFLFIDRLININESTIVTEYHLKKEADFFKGHFPGNPIMPGVLMCEACFQTGAMLMSKLNELSMEKQSGEGLGVVTRIKDTKFKGFAHPGDTLEITVGLEEMLANACYMKGKIQVKGKVIMQILFQVATIKAAIQ